MKNSQNTHDQEEVDNNLDFEDWELDHTTEMVQEFLDELILPELEAFDFNNEDENYVPGVACFTLFTKLIDVLSQNGWSSQDLKRAIDEFQSISLMSDNLH